MKHALFLFYEKPNLKKSNFAGDFYVAKMGDYFVDLFKRFPNPISSTIGGKFFKNLTSIEDQAGFLAQLAYTYEGDKINATLVRDALMREYKHHTGENVFDEILGNISSIPSDAIGWCAKNIEALKPTEKNYNPLNKDFSPLIPLLAVTTSSNLKKAKKYLAEIESNPFVQSTEEVFAQVWELVKSSASKVKNAAIEHLPESFKILIKKISGIINYVRNFLLEVENFSKELLEKGLEYLKILNAFLCGIINGLVGLLQCLLYILEFLLQPTTTFSYDQYLERRDFLEKAEDIIDWIGENVPKFFTAIRSLFTTSSDGSSVDMSVILSKMKVYFDKVSNYTIAFYVGVIAFEVLINILLLVFTSGAGNVVKGASYVQKAASLLKVLARETFSVVTLGITDLLAFLSRFIIKFGKACANGFKGFIKFIEELLQGSKNGAKAENLIDDVQDIEEVIIKGRKLQKGGGDINNTFAENAGIKIERWISEAKVIGQTENNTCAATSLRMVLNDKKIVRTEDELARALKTDANGASILDIPEALDFKRIDDITALAQKDIKLSKLLEKLADGDKAIVSVWTKKLKGHAMVLEKVENGKVFLRDPMPKDVGKSYSMKIEDFKSIFNKKAVIIKK